jgi:predicted dehydrogenase
VDLLLWLIDDKVEYVEAHTARRRHKSIEVEDLAEGIIGFKKGAYICFYLINFYSYDSDPEIDIDCQKGRVKIIKDSARVGFYGGKTMEAAPDLRDYIDYGSGRKDYWGVSHCVQIKDFYKSLQEGRQPQVDGAQGLKTQEVIWNIYKSARLGKRVYS